MRRGEILVPGRVLCVDEAMCAWRGKNGKWRKGGLPAVSKIARKPEGIGLELKVASDTETGMMLHLELAEGKVAMAGKDFADAHKAQTACALRLTRAYHGSARLVVGDSGFASVATARALLQKGLYFTGCVKTAHSESPKKIVEGHLEGKEKGTTRYYTAKLDGGRGNNILCVGWLDKKKKLFVSTCGNSAAGTPHQRKYHQVRANVEQERVVQIPRPLVVETYFKNANSIDVHDHYRQGGLELERHWRTHKWVHRAFATVLGMVETDAYLAYTHFGKDRLSHTDFTRALADALLPLQVEQELSPIRVGRRRSASVVEVVERGREGDDVVAAHVLLHLDDLPNPPKRARRADAAGKSYSRQTCATPECHARSSYACAACSAEAQVAVPYCYVPTSASTGQCYALHLMKL